MRSGDRPGRRRSLLGDAAPDARLLRATQANAPIDAVLGTRTGRPLDAAGGGFRGHAAGYVVAELDPPPGADPETVARLLADPAHRLLRAKGFVRCADGALAAIQVVAIAGRFRKRPPTRPPAWSCIGLKGQADIDAVQLAVARVSAVAIAAD